MMINSKKYRFRAFVEIFLWKRKAKKSGKDVSMHSF
jgi:hypothetical protein